MAFENIIKNISKNCRLSEEERQLFADFFVAKSIPKKTILLREGEICQFEGYIEKGCIRTYYIDENGFEITLYFSVEDWWVSDIASFQNQKPSGLYIETLEDCEMLMLSPETKEQLLTTLPQLERVFRLLVQRNLAALQKRLIHSFAKSATERYQEFIETYPDIPNRVAQYYIASYLGVSPEFISKIRKKMAS